MGCKRAHGKEVTGPVGPINPPASPPLTLAYITNPLLLPPRPACLTLSLVFTAYLPPSLSLASSSISPAPPHLDLL
jgi:hypothetical protein